MAALATAAGRPFHGLALGRRAWRAVVVIIAAALIAFLAFLAGEHHHQPQATVTSGIADVGADHSGSIVVADSSWVYGLSGVESWVDKQGQDHEGGWPACLSIPAGKTVPVKFGWVPVTGPDGLSWRQVVWVDCRP